MTHVLFIKSYICTKRKRDHPLDPAPPRVASISISIPLCDLRRSRHSRPPVVSALCERVRLSLKTEDSTELSHISYIRALAALAQSLGLARPARPSPAPAGPRAGVPPRPATSVLAREREAERGIRTKIDRPPHRAGRDARTRRRSAFQCRDMQPKHRVCNKRSRCGGAGHFDSHARCSAPCGHSATKSR